LFLIDIFYKLGATFYSGALLFGVISCFFWRG
jgi:hypothetical protein